MLLDPFPLFVELLPVLDRNPAPIDGEYSRSVPLTEEARDVPREIDAWWVWDAGFIEVKCLAVQVKDHEVLRCDRLAWNVCMNGLTLCYGLSLGLYRVHKGRAVDVCRRGVCV